MKSVLPFTVIIAEFVAPFTFQMLLAKQREREDVATSHNAKGGWLRFCLRVGLIKVTLPCVVLSLWVAPAERQRRAVAAIEAMDGQVEYADREAEPAEGMLRSFLRQCLPRDYLDEVRKVDLSDSKVTDAGLSHLQDLSALRRLALADTNITDAGLVHLRGLTLLRELRLNETHVTGAGLAHLKTLTGLEYLILDGLKINDSGLAHLQGLTKLKGLSLAGAPIGDGLTYLKGLTSLEVLYIVGAQVTDTRLTQLRKALPACRIYGP